MKLPALGHQTTQQRREVFEVLGDQVAHLAAAVFITLPLAVDGHQLGAHQFRALTLTQAFPHNHIDTASFILQRDENHAFGGLRLLPHGDEAAGLDQPPTGQVAQLRRRLQLQF